MFDGQYDFRIQLNTAVMFCTSSGKDLTGPCDFILVAVVVSWSITKNTARSSCLAGRQIYPSAALKAEGTPGFRGILSYLKL